MKKNKASRSLRISRYVIYKETLIDVKDHVWSFLGAFTGLLIIALIQSYMFTDVENVFLIGSFGATCVLIYGAVQSPLAQPRNLIGGHLFSALIGVTVYKLFPETIWISAPLAVALSIVAMQVTKTLHPPGGATALIAVIGTEKVKALGFWYILSPVLSGVLILLVVALIFNNLSRDRKYPTSGNYTRVIQWFSSPRKKT